MRYFTFKFNKEPFTYKEMVKFFRFTAKDSQELFAKKEIIVKHKNTTFAITYDKNKHGYIVEILFAEDNEYALRKNHS